MSWERMCRSKSKGGLGFRNLHDFNVARLETEFESGQFSRKDIQSNFPNQSFLSAKLGKPKFYLEKHPSGS